MQANPNQRARPQVNPNQRAKKDHPIGMVLFGSLGKLT